MSTPITGRHAGAHVHAALAWSLAQLRRIGRVLQAVFGVTRRHAPRWIVALLAVALAIPGPVDELIVLVIIGALVAIQPVLRAAMVTAVSAAWTGTI